MSSRKTVQNLVSASILASMLTACGVDGRIGRDEIDFEKYTAQEIYERGEYDLARGHDEIAAKVFSEVERLYPYSEWARRSLIMQAYSYHKGKDYENSRSAAQRFLDYYPTDDDAAYAQYLLALSYYDQIDDVGRDQGLTFQSLQALREVIEKFPDSQYARSAVIKFDLAFDHLAAKEMEIGRYYLRRQNYTAAIKRFQVVVQDFQTTSQTPEALHRLVEAYLALGLVNDARTAGAILAYNYRGTRWYADSYKMLTGQGYTLEAAGDGWLRQVYRQMVLGRWL